MRVRSGILTAVFLYLVFRGAGLLIVSGLDLIIESKILVNSLAHIMTVIITICVASILLKKVTTVRPFCDWEQMSNKAVLVGVTGTLAAVSIMYAITLVVDSFIQCSFLTAGNMDAAYVGIQPIEKIIVLISVSIAAPIFEELLFRGILFGLLQRVLNVHVAVLISALCFGVLHGTSVATVLVTGVIGGVLAYIYAVNNNLINCICIHGIYNFVVTAKAFKWQNIEPMTEEAYAEPDIGTVLLVAGVIMLTGMVMGWNFVRYIKQHLRNKTFRQC